MYLVAAGRAALPSVRSLCCGRLISKLGQKAFLPTFAVAVEMLLRGVLHMSRKLNARKGCARRNSVSGTIR